VAQQRNRGLNGRPIELIRNTEGLVRVVQYLDPLAVSSEAHNWRGSVWRMVETQHTASTMKIVDSQAEQDLLETLLERQQPAPPATAEALDTSGYPVSLRPGAWRLPFSFAHRSRRVLRRGVGTHASAELGYWRWNF